MAKETGAGQMPENNYIPEHRGLGHRVDRGQESYQPSPYEPRRVLPHGDVTREGDRVQREHSMTSKVLVYGGAAITAAAVTAGAILAVRKVADLVTGNDELDRKADQAAEEARERVYDKKRSRPAAPRFAELTEREREAMRARARARFEDADDARARARQARDEEPRRRPESEDRPRRRPRPRRQATSMNFLGEIEQSAQSLTRNLTSVVGAVGAAMAAFRSVADQAESVVKEFHGAADQVRNFLGTTTGEDAPTRARSSDPYRRPLKREVVDLRDHDDGEADQDEARTHRL